MPRRRRRTGFDELFTLCAFLLFVFIFYQPARKWFYVIACLSLLVGLTWLVLRLMAERKKQIESYPIRVLHYDAPAPPVPVVEAPLPQKPVYVSPPPLQRQAPATPPRPRLIDQLQSIDWFQFEKLIALAYRRLGYHVKRSGGANPDGGIDILIEKGGERTAVQCKHWNGWKVGVRHVREFLGALTAARIEKGIYITMRGYTDEARQFADQHGIQFLDETGVLAMLNEVGGPYDPEAQEILRDDRKYCPKCEAEMVLRTAGKGPSEGQQFWGCSRYPSCRYILRLNS